MNSEGRVAIVGDYDYQLQDQGYVLMLSANGTWNNEKTIVGGPVSHGGRATMGGRGLPAGHHGHRWAF